MGISTVTFGEVYTKFNYIVRSSNAVDETKKIDAFNEAYIELIRRMAQMGKGLEELLTGPTNLQWTISTHRIELPSDYCYLHSLWQQDGSDHRLVDRDRIWSLDKLIRYSDSNFNNTSDTGDFFYCAIAEPYLYLDKYATATDTDYCKILYYKIPTTLAATISLAISSVTGTFFAGETVTGSTSGNTGVIQTSGVSASALVLGSLSGSFSVETITGGTSGATATAGATTEKPQTLDINKKAVMLLATAAAEMYMKYRGHDNSAAQYSQELDLLIKQYHTVQAPGRSKIGIR